MKLNCNWQKEDHQESDPSSTLAALAVVNILQLQRSREIWIGWDFFAFYDTGGNRRSNLRLV